MEKPAVLSVLMFGLGLAASGSGAETAPWFSFQPKLKWLYLSSGVYLDRWGGTGDRGNGFAWTPKYRALNPPQALYSLSAGAAASITPVIGLALNAPVFYNTFEPYTDKSGGEHERSHRSGIGDIEIALPLKLGKATLQPQLAQPGPYEREYLVPWTGFGVYRGALGVSYPWRTHFFWASAERVLFKPTGEDSGLVEAGDYALKGGYSFKTKLAKRIRGKLGSDVSFTSFTWQPSAQAQYNFSIDPKISASFFPERKHELAFTLSATLYSTQAGEEDFRSYASRRVFAGFYYGLYL